jgi:DNA-binding PadR family transcriptional regulator
MSNGIAWPSGKELEVLRLLQSAVKGMYGLEIVEKSDGTIGRASVYILLSRLETKGFVDVTRPEKADHPGMPRPIYKVNGLGKKAVAMAEIMGMNLAGARS